MAIYFDSNVVRYLERGLAPGSLPEQVKADIVVSPITAIEVISQIATNDGERALESIHRMRDWLNQDHTVILDWTDRFYAQHVFHLDVGDDIFEVLERALNICLISDAVSPDLYEDAQALRHFNENAKRNKATLLRDEVARLKQLGFGPLGLADFSRQAIAEGLATRAGAGPDLRRANELARLLGAYFEYHADFIHRAVFNQAFNFFSREHLNDLFDAEQLLYLSDESLHFVTCDSGYRSVAQGAQAARIHLFERGDMESQARAPGLISGLIV
jgi:hypothetical protein